jgi:Cadherin-like domain
MNTPSCSTARLFRRALTFLLIAFGLLAPAAQAATMTRTYSFVATYPATTATGSFTVTFDPAVSVRDQSSGITVNSLNIPTQGAVVFSYDIAIGTLVIGADGSTSGINGSNDFQLNVGNAGTSTTPTFFTYSANPFTAPTSLTRGDIVTGGWVNGGNFTIGTVGNAADTNNWPAAESPEKAIDGNPATKFLLFKNNNAGLIITPPSAATYNRLALTTANDGPERDPASYIIYGSTSALPTSGTTLISLSGLTLIQQGTLALTNVRNNGTTVAGQGIVQFNNTTAYRSYVVVFPAVKNNPATLLTQIAEVKLSQGVTVPNQVAVGKAAGGKLAADFGSISWQSGTIRQSGDAAGNNWYPAESPDHALDGVASTTYLHFQGLGAALGVQPEAGPAVINSVSFWSGNNTAQRDPAGYEVYGMVAGFNPFSGGSTPNPWVLLKSGSLTLPTARNSGPVTVTFANSVAYQYYAVAFPSGYFQTGNLLTQIGEIAFATTTAPLVTTPTSASVLATTATLGGNVTSDGGSAITGRGVVYSLTSVDADPNIGDASVTKVSAAGTTTGIFTASVTGLTASSGYSFKAYATNGVGTTYTTLVATFSTAAPPATAPLVSSPTSTAVTSGSATMGGTVTADGGSPITGYGIVYSLTSINPNPLISGTGVSQSAIINLSGIYPTGPIAASAFLLSPNTSYSFKVYATNSVGTTYTTVATFTAVANANPTFSGYTLSTPKNTFAEVALVKLLTRAADADGGTLSITGASSNSAQGASIYFQSGSVGYDPPLNYTGLDTFTVTISDGQGGSVPGTVTVNVTSDSGASQNQAQLTLLPGGNVALLFQGIPGQGYNIQRSTDLQNWSDLSTVTAAPDGTLPYTDTAPPPGAAFYRTAAVQN